MRGILKYRMKFRQANTELLKNIHLILLGLSRLYWYAQLIPKDFIFSSDIRYISTSREKVDLKVGFLWNVKVSDTNFSIAIHTKSNSLVLHLITLVFPTKIL